MTSSVRLLLDEDIQVAVGTALQRRGVDAVHVHDLDRKGYTDADQLAYTVQKERCLVSYNVKDFVQLHNTYAQNGQDHWGILISSQRPIGEAFRRLLRLLKQYDQISIKNRIEFF